MFRLRYTPLLHPIGVQLQVRRRSSRETTTVPSMCARIAPPSCEVALRVPRSRGVTVESAPEVMAARMWAALHSEREPSMKHCWCLRDAQVTNCNFHTFLNKNSRSVCCRMCWCHVFREARVVSWCHCRPCGKLDARARCFHQKMTYIFHMVLTHDSRALAHFS